MPCPDLGALRVAMDDPPGAPAPLRDHVAACAACSDTLGELQRNAELAAPAIALTAPQTPPSEAATEAALARLEQRRTRLAAARSATTTTTGPVAVPAAPLPPPRRGLPALVGTRTRAVAAALAAAVVLAGLVATPGGRAAAAGFLAQFRSQRFQVLSLDAGQSTQLEGVVAELLATGVFTGAGRKVHGIGEPEVVGDLAGASRLAGFAVPAVDPSVLPRGVGPTPTRILATGAREVRIAFDRDQALAYLRRHGRPGISLPERYDGTRLVVQTPAVVVQQFSGSDGGPALLVAKAGMLGLDTEGGASLEELREVVLDLPGLPPETVAQLRAIDDWRTTLPLPVPADQVRWRPATVGGAEALGFTDPSGRLHALLWQRGGHVWGVAGVIGEGEARHVADSLG